MKEMITKIPQHVALILDGNGRWALQRDLPRTKGHEEGIKTLAEIVKEARNLGIKCLTAYAFSTDNFKREKYEVDYLMYKAEEYFLEYLKKAPNDSKYHLNIIGEKTNLSPRLIELINQINEMKFESELEFNLAFNYGSQEEITNAVKKIAALVENKKLDINQIDKDLITQNLYTSKCPPVDLVIRTSGEQRLSNYLLWQISYSELYFTTTYWPDFSVEEFHKALVNYSSRERRFGKEHA